MAFQQGFSKGYKNYTARVAAAKLEWAMEAASKGQDTSTAGVQALLFGDTAHLMSNWSLDFDVKVERVPDPSPTPWSSILRSIVDEGAMDESPDDVKEEAIDEEAPDSSDDVKEEATDEEVHELSEDVMEEPINEDVGGVPEPWPTNAIQFRDVGSTAPLAKAKPSSRPPWKASNTNNDGNHTTILVSLDLHNVLDVGPNHSIPLEFDVWIDRLLQADIEVIITSFIGQANQELRDSATRKVAVWNSRLRSTLPRSTAIKLPIPFNITNSPCAPHGKSTFLSNQVSGETWRVWHIDDCPKICQDCEQLGINTLRIRGPNPHRQHPPCHMAFQDLCSALEFLQANRVLL